MKAPLVTACICIACIAASARPVDPVTAQRVAERFLLSDTRVGLFLNPGDIALSIVHEGRERRIPGTASPDGQVQYYVFGYDGDRGFVIVAGDDVSRPILGWSDESGFDPDNLPPALVKWLDGCATIIRRTAQSGGEVAPVVKKEWAYYTDPTPTVHRRALHTPMAGPLLSTKWPQDPYVNALCPQGCPTGCVATAMAQIMKYWKHPTKGEGIHTYTHPQYGILTANFGATTYNWSAMPSMVNAPNQPVAVLMYHCGVAVDMGYGPKASGAWVINEGTNRACAQNAYVKYFGYEASTIRGIKRSSYSSSTWTSMIRAEIDAGRPIQYAGMGPGGRSGHTWVCDGYDGTGNFHMNWGWGGKADGWYSVDYLVPTESGTGGGIGVFTWDQQMIIGLKPASGGGSSSDADITLYAPIQISPNPIKFAQAFSVKTDFINKSGSDFNGDFSTAIFAADGTFIGFVNTKSTGSTPLRPNYHYTNGLTFSNTGLLAVPGQYTIAAFYRPSGKEWRLAESSTHANPVTVAIQGPTNTIQLNAAITPSPSTFRRNDAASVKINILNAGYTTYRGQYAAALYDLNGDFVEAIGTIDETRGLPAGYTYTAPYLTFTSDELDADPGTYLLAILEKPSGQSEYRLVGSENFPNPIMVTVAKESVSPDSYENNNSETSPSALAVTWNGSSARITTTNANIHSSSDIDYYGVHLPPNTRCTIQARVHDIFSETDGGTYTNDVLFAVKSDGDWSDNYDDVAPQMVVTTTQPSGQDITFVVAPYFAGFTGTYKLDVRITKSPISDVETIEPQSFACTLHPNPVHDALTVDLTGATLPLTEWSIVDALGRTCSSGSLATHAPAPIDVRALPPGMYRLLVRSGAVQRTLPFVKNQ